MVWRTPHFPYGWSLSFLSIHSQRQREHRLVATNTILCCTFAASAFASMSPLASISPNNPAGEIETRFAMFRNGSPVTRALSIASRSRTGTGQARPRHRSELHWRCGCRQSASDPFIFRQHLRLPDPLLGANAKMWALNEPHLANIFPRAIPLERSQRPAYSPRYSRVTITHFRHSFAYGCPLSAQPDLEARDVDVFLP